MLKKIKTSIANLLTVYAILLALFGVGRMIKELALYFKNRTRRIPE